MTKVRRAIALIALVWCAGGSASFADAIDDYVDAQLQKQKIPGAAIAVLRGGKPIKMKGYGFANLEHRAPVTTDTVFQIGSISKQFIATGIVVLASEGRLRLDDKIVQYLDGAPAAWREITIRQALSHTAGLVRESPAFDGTKRKSDAEVITGAYSLPLVFEPGTRYQYSNLGYFILAEIIQKTSGMPWPQFMQQRIFKSAQLATARETDPRPLIVHRASGYTYRDASFANAPLSLALRPSGAFMASIADLAKWEGVLRNDSLLDARTRELMRTPVSYKDGTKAPYGLGWSVETVNGHAVVHHGGSIGGFRSQYSRYLDDDLAVIVLTNAEGAQPDALAHGIAARYIDDLLPKRAVKRIDPATLEKYAGSYVVGPAGQGTVSVVGQSLVLKIPTIGFEIAFVPEADDLFFVEDMPLTQTRFIVEGERVTHLAFIMNGSEQVRMPRVTQ